MEVFVAGLQHEQKLVYWDKIVKKFRKSNLSVSEFAKKHDLKSHKLSYWKTRLEKEINRKSKEAFVEVVQKHQSNNGMSLSINDVITINFSSPPSPEWISELISSVKKVA